jgi:NhaP-type Na+/H+ or K+/H+ antiporter
MGAFEIFAIVASAIALVFVSWALFRMTRFPPGIAFILIGIVLSLAGSTVPQALSEAVKLSMPVLLGAVLFGCGLKMNLRGIRKNRSSLFLSFLTFGLTVSILWSVSHFVLGMSVLGSLLLGAVGASICSFFIFHIVDSVNLGVEVEDALMLESSMTEAASVLLALAVFQLSIGASALQASALGIVFGLLAGIIWVRLIRFTTDFPHEDALTLSLVLAVVAFCEMVFPNSGMMSALFFGLAMGNAGLLKTKVRFEGLLEFQEDVLMVGGTFVFFYAGLLVPSADLWLVLIGACIWVAILLIRFVSVGATLPVGFNFPVACLSPKGLSAALIVLMAIGNDLPEAGRLFAFTVPIILLSGIAAGVSPWMMERKRPPKLEGLKSKERSAYESPPEKPISHAYDIDEVKRTINRKEE